MFKYFKESFQELSRVSWPNFNTTLRLTIIILIFSGVTAAIIGGVDYLLNAGYNQVVDFTIESGIRTDQITTGSEATNIEQLIEEAGLEINTDDNGTITLTGTDENGEAIEATVEVGEGEAATDEATTETESN